MAEELTEERKKEIEKGQAELQEQANNCIREVEAVFKKYNCHMLITASFSSDGKMNFKLDAETNLNVV